MRMRYWDIKFHILVPLDPPHIIGWGSRISFYISKASNILSWFSVSQECEHRYDLIHRSDPHYVKSWTSLVFLLGVVAPSWRVFETDHMATSTNHYLNDNVSCVARMQTGYIISNITILHILQVKSCDWFVHRVSTNFYVPEMCSWNWYMMTSEYARIRRSIFLNCSC